MRPCTRHYRTGISAPLLLSHRSSLAHDPGPHPESAERMRALEAALAARGGLGWRREESVPAPRSALESVHSGRSLDAIERFCEEGGGAIDADTRASRDTWEAALHGAGGAVQVVDALVGGEAPSAFSAHRPPGHHADAGRAMGFCFLNHVAVAAQHAIDAHGLERVLVLDWDVHHGNGTNDIFHASAQVLYASIHESPLYPGTGPASDVGTGAGEGYTVNLPVPGGSGDAVWCSMAEHVVAEVARAYEPQLILISAGYDAHREDPLATCEVSDAGFATMARSLRHVADQLGAPLGGVLEGGYAVEAMARSVVATLEVLGDEGKPREDEIARHPLAEQAAARLAPYWPQLR